MYNRVILIGNLTRDVDLKHIPNGSALAKIGLATNRKYKDSMSGEMKSEVMFIDVDLWGRTAETASQYLRKGSKVLVEGRLTLQQWTDQSGQKRSKHSVTAEKLQFLDSKSDFQNGGNQNNNYQNQNSSGYGNSYNNPPQNSSNSYENSNQFDNGSYSPPAQQQPTRAPQNQVPSQSAPVPEINIDDEDIPF